MLPKVLLRLVYLFFSHKTWTKMKCRNPSESSPEQNFKQQQQFHVFCFVGFFSPRIATTENIIIVFQKQPISLTSHGQKKHKNKTRWTVALYFKSKVWQEKHQVVSHLPSCLAVPNCFCEVLKVAKAKLPELSQRHQWKGKKCDKLKKYC